MLQVPLREPAREWRRRQHRQKKEDQGLEDVTDSRWPGWRGRKWGEGASEKDGDPAKASEKLEVLKDKILQRGHR